MKETNACVWSCIMGFVPFVVSAAVPAVSNVTASAGTSGSRSVTINYELEAPAIVTIDVLTNGVSIGKDKLKFFSGDCNRVVQGGARTAYWAADKAWSDGPRLADGVTFRVTSWALNAPPPFMVIDLVEGGAKRFYTSAAELPEPGGITNRVYKTTKFVMRKIPAAGVEWRMGAEGSQRLVTLTEDYYIGVFEWTRGQSKTKWGVSAKGILATQYGSTSVPSEFDVCPLESLHTSNLRGGLTNGVDWPTTGTACYEESLVEAVRQATGLPALDLPTEAQWEFACRAGTGTKYYNGTDDDTTYDELAYSGEIPGEVGLKKPNGFDLYDMLGNAPEWCLDAYTSSSLEAGTFTNPQTGPASDSDNKRVLRGGGFTGTSCGHMRTAFVRTGNKDLQTAPYFSFGVRFCAPAVIPAP